MIGQPGEQPDTYHSQIWQCREQIKMIKEILDHQASQRQLTVESINGFLNTIDYVKDTIQNLNDHVPYDYNNGIDVVLNYLRHAGMELNMAAEDLDYRSGKLPKSFFTHILNSYYYLDGALKAW